MPILFIAPLQDNVETIFYTSSNIMASEYFVGKNILRIYFKSKTAYDYKNVDIVTYSKFKIAESQGAFLNDHIKKPTKYPYTRLAMEDIKESWIGIDNKYHEYTTKQIKGELPKKEQKTDGEL